MPRTIWWMQALGRDGLPQRVDVDGVSYALEQPVKHDFWAATGFYRDPNNTRVVVKIHRRVSILGVPMRWVGRWVKRREVRAYTKLADLANIPTLIGDATDTGFVHAFAAGEPLRQDREIPGDFFDQLLTLLDEMNDRGIAYVDTNKPENIIVGEDGKPHLIDFQISFDASVCWPSWLGRWILRRCHRADVYHVLKQKRRFRPDLLTARDIAKLERRSVALKVHRTMTRPYFMIRRPAMRWLRRSGRVSETGSN